MTGKQLFAVRCALADLCGALQAFDQNDIHVHDWRAHKQTIWDIAEAFNLMDELPKELT